MNPTLLPEAQSKVFDELLIAQQTAFQNDKAMQEHLEWVQEQNQAFMEQMQRDQGTANQMHQDAMNQHNQMQQQQMQQQMAPPAGMP